MKDTKPTKRFSFSLNEAEAYALERHFTGGAQHPGDGELLAKFRQMLTLRMTKHEAESFAADIGWGQEMAR